VSIPIDEEGKGGRVQRYGTRHANTIHRALYEKERFTVVPTQANVGYPEDGQRSTDTRARRGVDFNWHIQPRSYTRSAMPDERFTRAIRERIITTPSHKRPDPAEIRRLLAGTSLIRNGCDLDLLVFLYRHPRTLLTSQQIAAFVGRDMKVVAEALDAFIAAGFVERLQNPTHADRMYLLVVHGPEGKGLDRLLELASTRQGRQEILTILNSRNEPRPEHLRRSWHPGENFSRFLSRPGSPDEGEPGCRGVQPREPRDVGDEFDDGRLRHELAGRQHHPYELDRTR